MLYYGSNKFGRVEPPRTHDNLSYDPCSLWSSVVWGGSVRLCHPPSHTWFCLLYYGLKMFGRVEPLRACEKLPDDLWSLWSWVVQGGSVGLYHPEVKLHLRRSSVCCTMINYPLWSSVVRGGSVALNHPELMSFEPPQTLCWCCRLHSHSKTVVRAGLKLNHPKLMINYPVGLVQPNSGSSLFIGVEPSRTHEKLLNRLSKTVVRAGLKLNHPNFRNSPNYSSIILQQAVGKLRVLTTWVCHHPIPSTRMLNK